MADAGWYPDAFDPNWLRYFDGQRWTDELRLRTDPSVAQYSAPQAPSGWQQPTPAPQPPWEPPPARAAPQWGTRPDEPHWAAAQNTGYPQPAAGPWEPPQPPQPPPATPWQIPPAAPRKRRTVLWIAVAAVVVLAAGLVTWLVWPNSPPPKFTYQGKALSAPDETLSSAESKVGAMVQQRHGAKNAQTRCYYAQRNNPASGTKKSDVEKNLRCGPVLFVDGDPAQTYLSVATTSRSAKGGEVELTPQPPADDAQPAAVPADVQLNRPDGKRPPAGNAGLKVPDPPPADANVLTVADLGPTNAPPSLTNAVMVGKDIKVSLTAAGQIPRYGAGDDARTAPAGQKLVAFQYNYGAGDVSATGTARATLVVAAGLSRPVPQPDSGEWVIAAVPTSATPAVQLVDGGATQTLALPSGQPGANNIAVLTRMHRIALSQNAFNVPVRLSKGRSSVNVTFRGRMTVASLDYWIPGQTDLRASSPHNAILSMKLFYTQSGEAGTFGFDARILMLRLPDGRVVHARNVAAPGRIEDVFEVPAAFTRGTVEITGAEQLSGGITLRVMKTTAFPVSIPAG